MAQLIAYLQQIDTALFYRIYSFDNRSPYLDALIIFCASYLIWGIIGVVVYSTYRNWRAGKWRREHVYFLAIVAAVTSILMVVEPIHLVVERTRPFIAFNLPHLITQTSYSFPSMHTIFIFTLATVLTAVNKRLAYAVYILGSVVGIARIAAGVHYPSDIAGGMVLGVVTGLIILHIYTWGGWKLPKH